MRKQKEEPTTASRNRYIHTCAPQDRGFSTRPEHAGSNERTWSWVTERFSQQSRALQASLSSIMRSTAHISEASLGSDGRFNQILCEASFTIKALFQKSLRFTKEETVRIQPLQETTDPSSTKQKKKLFNFTKTINVANGNWVPVEALALSAQFELFLKRLLVFVACPQMTKGGQQCFGYMTLFWQNISWNVWQI